MTTRMSEVKKMRSQRRARQDSKDSAASTPLTMKELLDVNTDSLQGLRDLRGSHSLKGVQLRCPNVSDLQDRIEDELNAIRERAEAPSCCRLGKKVSPEVLANNEATASRIREQAAWGEGLAEQLGVTLDLEARTVRVTVPAADGASIKEQFCTFDKRTRQITMHGLRHFTVPLEHIGEVKVGAFKELTVRDFDGVEVTVEDWVELAEGEGASVNQNPPLQLLPKVGVDEDDILANFPSVVGVPATPGPVIIPAFPRHHLVGRTGFPIHPWGLGGRSHDFGETICNNLNFLADVHLVAEAVQKAARLVQEDTAKVELPAKPLLKPPTFETLECATRSTSANSGNSS